MQNHKRMCLMMLVCAVLAVFAQRLLSQNMGSGGFSSRAGSSRSRSMRMGGMSGRPDFERMRGMSPEERMKYMQRRFEDQRKAAERQEASAMQQTLGANDKQWKVIEPKLKKVKSYREQAFIGTKPPFQSNFSSFSTGPGGLQGGGFTGGSFQFQAGGSMSPGAPGGPNSLAPQGNPDRPLTDGERLIEELQWLLQDPDPEPNEVRQKLAALRKAREKATQQWVRAQQELRKVLDLRQEATLVMMGLLN